MQLLSKISARILGISIVFNFVLLCSVASASALDLYPGATVESDTPTVQGEFSILLSSPKRISNALVIEKQKLVKGLIKVKLLALRSGSDIKSAFHFYQELLGRRGKLAFHCEKRACGSSNYWANKIFNEHRLYGRDSDQYYLAGTVDSPGGTSWVSMYFVSNALRQGLVYIVTVDAATGPEVSEGGWLNGAVYSSTALEGVEGNSLRDYLSSAEASHIYIVAYADQNIEPTKSNWSNWAERSKMLVRQLKGAVGNETVEVASVVLGSLHHEEAPDGESFWFRLYVY